MPILQKGKGSSGNLSIQCGAVSKSHTGERQLEKPQSPESVQNEDGFKLYWQAST